MCSGGVEEEAELAALWAAAHLQADGTAARAADVGRGRGRAWGRVTARPKGSAMRNCSAPLPLPVNATVRRMPSPSVVRRRRRRDSWWRASASPASAPAPRRQLAPAQRLAPASRRPAPRAGGATATTRRRLERRRSRRTAGTRPPGPARRADRRSHDSRPPAPPPAPRRRSPRRPAARCPATASSATAATCTAAARRHRRRRRCGVTAAKRSVRSRSTMVSWATIATGGGALTAGSTTVLAGGVIGPCGPRSRAMEMVTGMSMVPWALSCGAIDTFTCRWGMPSTSFGSSITESSVPSRTITSGWVNATRTGEFSRMNGSRVASRTPSPATTAWQRMGAFIPSNQTSTGWRSSSPGSTSLCSRSASFWPSSRNSMPAPGTLSGAEDEAGRTQATRPRSVRRSPASTSRHCTSVPAAGSSVPVT